MLAKRTLTMTAVARIAGRRAIHDMSGLGEGNLGMGIRLVRSSRVEGAALRGYGDVG